MAVARGAGVLDQTFSETFNHPVSEEPPGSRRPAPSGDSDHLGASRNEHPANNEPRGQNQPPSTQQSGVRDRQPPSAGTSNPEVPRCDEHGLPCVEREVSREGPNKGRKFFVCPQPQSEQCNFFAWADAGPSSASTVSVKCTGHDEPCVERTVRKEGPNKGRCFYSCRRGQTEGSCGFFAWKEDVEDATTRPAPTSSTPASLSGPEPKCTGHSLPCALRTTRKPGENQNRQFYACALPAVESCGFFVWKDEHEGQQPSRRATSSTVAARHDTGDQETPQCECGLPGILLTCRNGANKGRTFYKCPNQQGSQCNFFEWAS
jgi:hypothetical protein